MRKILLNSKTHYNKNKYDKKINVTVSSTHLKRYGFRTKIADRI